MRVGFLLAVALVPSGTLPAVAAQEPAPGFQLAAASPRFLTVDERAARTGAPRWRDASEAAVFRQRIALDLRDVSLGVALEEIARKAGLRLTYSAAVVRVGTPVTLSASDLTVGAALSAVLYDAGVDVLLTSSRQAALIKRVHLEPPAGAIVGLVTDAKTGEGLDGAEMLLEGTKWRTLAAQDGQYRLAEVEAGSYTLVARRIGYGRQVRAVTVVADQELTADFALEPHPTRLEEVVVTGTVIPTEVKALPTPITVITAEEIEEHHPERVTDLLRLFVPGVVTFEPYAGAFQSTVLAFRGTSGLAGPNGSSPKFYVDGVEVTSHTNAPADPQSIERIEVIRGPQAAAIYGSDAMGGVVQIFTKRGAVGRQRPELEARAALGVIESEFEGSGALRQQYDGAFRGRTGSASYHLGGGYTGTGEWIPDYASSAPSVYGGLRVEQGPLTLDLSGRYYQQGNDDPLNPLVLATGAPFFSPIPSYRRDEFREETYAARADYQPTAWWRHSVTLGIDRLSRSFRQRRPRLTTPSDTLLFVQLLEARKASLAYHTSVTTPLAPGLTASLAGGVDHYTYSSSSLNTNGALTTDPLRLAPGRSLNGSTARTTNSGYFAQVQLNLRERLFLTGAVRGESNSDFGDDLGVPVSPRVGFTYVHQLGGTTVKLRTSYGEATRPPVQGWKERFLSAGSEQLANPALRPESQKGPDAGVDLVFGGRGSLSVTYYHQIAKDLIQPVTIDPTATPPSFQWQNFARVENTGWEFEGTLALGRVSLAGSLSIANSRPTTLEPFFGGDQQLGEQIIGMPRHTGALTLTATPVRRASVTAGLVYVGRRTQYDWLAYYRCFGGTGPCRNDDFSTDEYLTEYGHFVTSSVSIDQQLSGTLSAYLSVDDLTNRGSRGTTQNDLSAPGRITTIGVRARY